MKIRIFDSQELNAAAKNFCSKHCPLKDTEKCVLSPESAGGIICPISHYLDKLFTGELKQ